MIQPQLTTIHRFHYVHIGFWILRIAIRPILNNYYNITNAPTRLHLSEMKRISGSHYFLCVFTNLTLRPSDRTISFLWMKVVCSVLRRVNLRRIYCSVAQDMKFHWSTQTRRNVTLLGNTNIRWCRATPKLTKTSSVTFSDLFGACGLFS